MLGWLYQNQLKIIYEQSNLGIAIKNSSNYLHTSDHLMKRALFWTGVVYNIFVQYIQVNPSSSILVRSILVFHACSTLYYTSTKI